MPPNLQPVAGLIPEHQKQQIEAIGGADGVSAGLRDVVAAGLLALQGDAALLAPVEELQALVTRLSFIQGRRTGSGAWWCPANEALPSADQLNPVGDVVATPDGVALLAGNAALIVDLGAGVLVSRENGRETSIEVDITQLMQPMALLPAAIAGLAGVGQVGRRDLGAAGLALELTGSGAMRLSAQGLGVTASDEVLLCLAAELLSLATRTLAKSAAARRALNEVLLQTEVQP